MPPQVAFGGMMPNFPMVPPFGGFPFGMPPHMFPYWNNFMYPQPMPGMPGIPFPPPMSSTADTTTVSSSQFFLTLSFFSSFGKSTGVSSVPGGGGVGGRGGGKEDFGGVGVSTVLV
jgi:hypothetical protein